MKKLTMELLEGIIEKERQRLQHLSYYYSVIPEFTSARLSYWYELLIKVKEEIKDESPHN